MIYVKNRELREEIIRCKANNELSPEAIQMFYLMIDKFSHKFSYKYETDRDDCKSQAIIDCYMYWRGYDPEKSQNAFAYYTQIIKNGFAKGWRTIHDANFSGAKMISYSHNNIYTI